MHRAPARSRHVWIFLILCALPMLGVFPYLAVVNNPNENVRTYMTMAIVERGTLRIDDMVQTFGWVNDMAKVPQKDGTAAHFSVKAPATSLAGVPGYWLYTKVAGLFGRHFPGPTTPMADRAAWLRNATWACRLFAVQLPCYLFLIWFERYLRAFTRDRAVRLSAVAAACLGTNYLAYTHMFASHATFAIAAFCGFAMTERELRRSRGDSRERRVSKAFLAGFFVGWTVLLEYHALPVALCLALYGLVAFWRPTRLLAFAAGGLINAATMMLFQWSAFGNPLTPGHKMVENARFAAEHHQGVFGILMPQVDRMLALSFDPGFGFFGTSPFMLLGLLAIPLVLLSGRGAPHETRIRRWGAFVWMTAMLGLWAVNSGFIQWRAGWTVGPRYLGAAPPFFAFGAVLALERLAGSSPTRRTIVRGVAGGLAFASVVSIGTVGLLYDTLPETIQRPFAQFAVPLIRTATVPHHVGEWFGWVSASPWYIACLGMLGATLLAGIGYGIRDFGTSAGVLRAFAFSVALALGIAPALSKPDDHTEMFVLHPDTRPFVQQGWEPPGRDRITLLREDAERYGPRRPCAWHKLAELDRALGNLGQAIRDEAHARGTPRDRCPKVWF